jgi:hypothetical protein
MDCSLGIALVVSEEVLVDSLEPSDIVVGVWH